MNIREKLERVLPALESIITHTDGDSTLRKGALDQIIARCQAGKGEIDAETAAQVQGLTPEV
jgi:primosomal protein N'